MEPVVRHVVRTQWPGLSFIPITFQGKPDLMRRLPGRLAGYRTWPAQAGLRIVVLVDRDDDDCHNVKAALERMSADAHLATLSSAQHGPAMVANRVVCEELEAWFFGDMAALCSAFPRLPPLSHKSAYRHPDEIRGGTAERLERELQAAGYCLGGMGKPWVAARVAPHLEVTRNTSPSFRAFVGALRSLVAIPDPPSPAEEDGEWR